MLKNTNPDTEVQILAQVRQLTDLMIKADTAAMATIIAPDFTLTHITGYVQSKEEWFTEIKSGGMKYFAYKELRTTVNITGDKAILVGQNLLDARIWGTRNNWRIQQRMLLQKQEGRWIILKSVATTF